MRGLEYQFSIPKYVLTKIYNAFNLNKYRPYYPNLVYRDDLPMPELLGDRWVVLKSLMCGICGSDLNVLKAAESYSMEPYGSFPCILGHENVSEIIECGKGVKNFKAGDRVIVNPVMGCKVHERIPECSFCSDGMDALCAHFSDKSKLGAGMSLGYQKSTGGGWAEFYQAHETQLYKIGNEIPLKRAVLADPFSSALQPIAEYAMGKKEKRDVLIYGAGTIGLLAVKSIRSLDLPWRVGVVYRYDFQGEMAKKMGADLIFKANRSLYKAIANTYGAHIIPVSVGKPVVEGSKLDAVFDCVGSPSTLDDSLRIVRPKGKVILVATSNSLKGVDPSPLWFREVELVGTCMSRSVIDPRDGEVKQVYQIVKDLIKNTEIEDLVTDIYKISDFKKALSSLFKKKSQKSIKVTFSYL